MAWLRRLPEEAGEASQPSSRPSSRGPRERCQREACVQRVAALKEEIKQLNDQLRPLARNFSLEVEGQVRRVAADLAEVQSKLEHEMECRRQANKVRTFFEKAARELADEREQLLSKVAADRKSVV